MERLEAQTLELFEIMQQFHRQKKEVAQQRALFQGEMSILLFLCHSPSDSCSHAEIFAKFQKGIPPDVRMTPSEISSGLHMPRPTVTVFLNSLEEKGYIRRQIKQRDRRSLEVSITPQGMALLQQKAEGILQRTQSILRRLGEEDTTSLLRILTRCVDLLWESDSPAPDNTKRKEEQKPC